MRKERLIKFNGLQYLSIRFKYSSYIIARSFVTIFKIIVHYD